MNKVRVKFLKDTSQIFLDSSITLPNHSAVHFWQHIRKGMLFKERDNAIWLQYYLLLNLRKFRMKNFRKLGPKTQNFLLVKAPSLKVLLPVKLLAIFFNSFVFLSGTLLWWSMIWAYWIICPISFVVYMELQEFMVLSLCLSPWGKVWHYLFHFSPSLIWIVYLFLETEIVALMFNVRAKEGAR